MEQKKKNQGFTLLELVVSVTILAVITIPLMHSFVTAARTNQRSKYILEATSIAQSLMDEYKNTNLQELVASPGAIHVTSTAVKVTDVNGVETEAYDSSGAQICQISVELDQSPNGHPYHAKLTFDPSDYLTDKNYNNELWAELSNLSKANNAFLIMNRDEAGLVASEITKQLPPGNVVSTGTIRAGLNREIRIKVTSNAEGHSVVKASVFYQYRYAGQDYSYYSLKDQEIFNNGTGLSNRLSGIFLCYYPMYNNVGRNAPTETMIIENTDNYPVDVYLIKQKDESNPPTSDAENRYALMLTVEEGSRSLERGADGKIPAVTKLVTNMGYRENLATGRSADDSELRLNYTGNTNALPGGGTYRELFNLYYSRTDNNGATVNGVEKGKSEVRIYKVTIEIYEGKSHELLTTLEGTKTE